MLQIEKWTSVDTKPTGLTFNASQIEKITPYHKDSAYGWCKKFHPVVKCTVLYWKKKSPNTSNPYTKNIKGKTYYCCGKCKCWNLTHIINDHGSKAEVLQDSSTNASSQDQSHIYAAYQ